MAGVPIVYPFTRFVDDVGILAALDAGRSVDDSLSETVAKLLYQQIPTPVTESL